jgi:hypothetical protein
MVDTGVMFVSITGEDNFSIIGNARFCLPREQNNEIVS